MALVHLLIRNMNANNTLDEQAGQGGLPTVPAAHVPCERCKEAICVEDGRLPLYCPHCHYRLRPESDSILSNFFFVLRYRYLAWRGRATRKEFWSFTLIMSLLWGILYLISSYMILPGVPHGDFLAQPHLLIAYGFMLGLPLIFLTARRLHDINLSGSTVLIHLLLVILMFLLFIIGYLVLADYSISDEIDSDFAFHGAYSTFVLLFSGGYLLGMAAQGFSLFFFVVSLINSKRGTNVYGPSRKYTLS